MRIGSLCSGYGGLDMAIQAAIGGELAWVSEYEPPTEKEPNPPQSAAKVLAYRHPDVPNLGDMTAVDWSSVEPVDVLGGGTPCQDVSHAGRRAGMRAGTRSGLWASMVDAIDVLRPELVVWENVRGVYSAGADSGVEPCPLCVGDGAGPSLRALGRVLGDLADVGYDARWCGLPASAVGAPHGRFRAFVVAHPRSVRRESWRGSGPREAESGRALGQLAGRGARAAADTENDGRSPQLSGGHEPEESGAAGDRAAVADTSSERRGEGWPEPGGQLGGPDASERGVPAATDTDRHAVRVEPVALTGSSGTAVAGQPVQWGVYEPAVRRWERVLGRPAPAPRQLNRRGDGEQLSPRFTEWMMGLPSGWVTDVPGLSRNEQLHVLGNGVVPQQGEAAIRHLLEAL